LPKTEKQALESELFGIGHLPHGSNVWKKAYARLTEIRKEKESQMTDNKVEKDVHIDQPSGKYVTAAHVEVVNFGQLKIGDYILWASWKRKVLKKIPGGKCEVSNPCDNTSEIIGPFMTWYSIVTCDEKDIETSSE